MSAGRATTGRRGPARRAARRPARRRRCRLPGSKSLTNRALVCAALAEGTSHARRRPGRRRHRGHGRRARRARRRRRRRRRPTARVDGDRHRRRGCAPARATLDARLSGTTGRFLLPVLAAGRRAATGSTAAPPLRARPMGAGARRPPRRWAPAVEERRARPPAGHRRRRRRRPRAATCAVRRRRVEPVPVRPAAGRRRLRRDGAATCALTHRLVSRPYVDLTVGGDGRVRRRRSPSDDDRRVRRRRRRATGPPTYAVEPDASAASYFFAAAAIAGGRVHRRRASGRAPLQGDARASSTCSSAMGADGRARRPTATDGAGGTGTLRGGRRRPAPTCPTRPRPWPRSPRSPTRPTRVTGIGFIRAQGDRPHRRRRRASCAAAASSADEDDDGFVVHPGTPRPATRRDLRRPPHGDELRPARPAGAGHRDRRPRLRGQDVPRLLATRSTPLRSTGRPATGRLPAR